MSGEVIVKLRTVSEAADAIIRRVCRRSSVILHW
jgi:hypothetical protein